MTARIEDGDADDGLSIFPHKNIVARVDGFRRMLRFAEAHVEHVRFFVIVNPHTLRGQIDDS